MGAALLANDMLSFDRNRLPDPEKHLPGGRLISRWELCRRLPEYDFLSTTGAALWHDAQVYNTERLLLEFILSAVDAGADVANYVEALELVTDGKRINGVRATDVQTRDVFEIHSRLVVNCAGAWIDSLLETVSLNFQYATSIAMNVIVDQVWPRVAVGLPTRPADGKTPQILFFVPWRNKTMIGTWHIPWNDPPGHFRVTDAVVREFLNEINSAGLPRQLSIDDIQHVTWGFLPVNKKDAYEQPVRLTRDGAVIDHHEKDGISGLISVLGVKYTTARVVAEQAINLAVQKLSLRSRACQTHEQPVKGGEIADFASFMKQAVASARGLQERRIIEHLVHTYGSEYRRFEKCDLLPIHPDLPVIEAEVIHAVREEMAVTLLDVIQRRTELGAAGLPSMDTLQKCAELMARELGWSRERRECEIESIIHAYPFERMKRVAG
jgi:glycerol-3-phosphate dehydrogenase